MTWSDAAQWFSGIATLIAVIVAFYFSRRQESRVDEETRANVYVWTIRETSDGGIETTWQLFISNGTSYPLYKWDVELRWEVGGVAYRDSVSQAQLGVIPPGQRPYAWNPDDALPDIDASVLAQIEFTDHRGLRWRRTTSGELVKLKR